MCRVFETVTISKNIAISIVSFLAGLAILGLATPWYLSTLGLERFGIYSLLASITAPLGILTAGLGQAVTRTVVQSRTKREDPLVAERAVRSALAMTLIIAVLVTPIMWALCPWIVCSLMHINLGLAQEAIDATRVGVLIWVASQLFGIYQAVVVGMERFDVLAVVAISQQALTHSAGAVAAGHFHRVTPVLFISLGVMLLATVAVMWLSRRWFSARLWLPWIHEGQLQKLTSFSGWQMVNVAAGILSSHIDRLMLGSFAGAAKLGVYSAAASVQGRLVATVWTGLGALFPAFSRLDVEAGASERLLEREGWAMSFVPVVLYGLGYAAAPHILPWWLGAEAGMPSARVLRLLFLVAIAATPSAIVFQYLLGKASTASLALSNCATMGITVMISLVTIKRYGLDGAALGLLAATWLTRPLFHGWIFGRSATPEMRPRLMGLLYGPVISGTILCLSIGWFERSAGSFYQFDMFSSGALFCVLLVSIEMLVWGRSDQLTRLGRRVRSLAPSFR